MKILIVGHGEYSTGIKSVIKSLTGIDNQIDAINFNEKLTRDEFENMVKKYVKETKELIVFADITGGAPFQIISRAVLSNEASEEQYVVGGISVACILEIVMNTLVVDSGDKTREIIDNTINKIKDMAIVMCRKDLRD